MVLLLWLRCSKAAVYVVPLLLFLFLLLLLSCFCYCFCFCRRDDDDDDDVDDDEDDVILVVATHVTDVVAVDSKQFTEACLSMQTTQISDGSQYVISLLFCLP